MTVTRELRRRLRADRPQPRFQPCLPRPAKEPPAGPGWIHEIKHDGFRIIARHDATGVRLITRNGYDLAARFPLAAAAIATLPARSCVVDGEAIAVDDNGLSVFDLIHHRRQDHAVTLCAFDLIELDGEDLRREPIEVRSAPSRGYCAERIQASFSTGISIAKALLSSGRPARSAARALCRSALARPVGRAVDRVVRELKKHGVEITEDGVRLMKKFG